MAAVVPVVFVVAVVAVAVRISVVVAVVATVVSAALVACVVVVVVRWRSCKRMAAELSMARVPPVPTTPQTLHKEWPVVVPQAAVVS